MLKQLLIASAMACAVSLSAQGIVPPCTLSCETQEDFNKWTPLDHNEDEKTWTYNSDKSCADYTYHSTNAGDDYLFSNETVTLRAGQKYEVKANVRSYNSSTAEAFSIYVGKTTVPENLTLIYDNSNLATTTFTFMGGEYTPEEDGEYYFAIYAHSSKNKWHVYFKALNIEPVVALPLAATDGSATAGEMGALTATVSWTMPTRTSFDTELTSIGGARIYRDKYSRYSSVSISDATLVGTFEGGEPGQQATWIDNTVPEGGLYEYAVVPFDANGASKATPLRINSPWIGPDTGVSSSFTVTAAKVDGSDNTVKISWETPAGSNGGYVDASKIRYRISRKGKINTSSTYVVEDFSGNEFTDNTIVTLDEYTYTISVSYNSSSYSWSGSSSNGVVAGPPYSVPYAEDFSSSNSLLFWTLFHGEGATRDWSLSSSALKYWGYPADAWAATPPIQLNAGVPYEMSFNSYVNKATSPKELYIYVGSEPTAASLSETEIFHETISNISSYQSRKVNISVPADGVYYIAFRCFGPSDSNDLYVDNISLTETVFTPGAVSDFKAEAAPEGVMAANISWTNPTVNNIGEPLPEITKAEILRKNAVAGIMVDPTLVATITEGLTPGETATYTDNNFTDAVPGKYTYTLKLYLGENAGDAVTSTTEWIGPDTPATPTDVTVTVAEDGSRSVAFSHETTGVNGGYVDPAALRYEITRNGELIASDVTDSPFIDEEVLQLGSYIYGVKAVFGELMSDEAKAAAVVFGAPLELPYTADFANEKDLWTLTGDRPNNTWTIQTGWSSYLLANYASDNSWAFTPPIHMPYSIVTLTGEGQCYTTSSPEHIEFYLSKSTDHTNAEHHTLIGSSDFTSGNSENFSHEFTTPGPGTYYIGFRILTNKHQARIYAPSLAVTFDLSGVESVSSDFNGQLMYSAAFESVCCAEAADINVYSASGVLMASGKDVTKLSVADLPAGVYVATGRLSGGKALPALKFAK